MVPRCGCSGRDWNSSEGRACWWRGSGGVTRGDHLGMIWCRNQGWRWSRGSCRWSNSSLDEETQQDSAPARCFGPGGMRVEAGLGLWWRGGGDVAWGGRSRQWRSSRKLWHEQEESNRGGGMLATTGRGVGGRAAVSCGAMVELWERTRNRDRGWGWLAQRTNGFAWVGKLLSGAENN